MAEILLQSFRSDMGLRAGFHWLLMLSRIYSCIYGSAKLLGIDLYDSLLHTLLMAITMAFSGLEIGHSASVLLEFGTP